MAINNSDIEKLISLLEVFFQGEISPYEKTELEALCEKYSSVASELFDEETCIGIESVLQLKLMSSDIISKIDMQTPDDLEKKLSLQISAMAVKSREQLKFRYIYRISSGVAAAVVLIFGAFFMFHKTVPSGEKTKYAYMPPSQEPVVQEIKIENNEEISIGSEEGKYTFESVSVQEAVEDKTLEESNDYEDIESVPMIENTFVSEPKTPETLANVVEPMHDSYQLPLQHEVSSVDNMDILEDIQNSMEDSFISLTNAFDMLFEDNGDIKERKKDNRKQKYSI